MRCAKAVLALFDPQCSDRELRLDGALLVADFMDDVSVIRQVLVIPND